MRKRRLGIGLIIIALCSSRPCSCATTVQDQFFSAIDRDDPLAIITIIRAYPGWFDWKDNDGKVGIVRSIRDGKLNATALFLRPEFTKFASNEPLLREAVISGRPEFVTAVLVANKNVLSKSDADSLLELAVKMNNKNISALLIAFKIANDERFDNNLLEVAAQQGADDVIQLLLNIGLVPTKHNQFAFKSAEDILLFLKEHPEFKLDSSSDAFGLTPLHYASMGGKRDTVKLLIEKGGKCISGRLGSPLHWAARNGRSEVVKNLIELGLNVNEISPWYGATPLLWASEHGNADTVRVLLKSGADPDNTGSGNKTAIEIAILNGNYDAARAIDEFKRRQKQQ